MSDALPSIAAKGHGWIAYRKGTHQTPDQVESAHGHAVDVLGVARPKVRTERSERYGDLVVYTRRSLGEPSPLDGLDLDGFGSDLTEPEDVSAETLPNA